MQSIHCGYPGLNEMADVFSQRKRNEIMSRVRGKNTKPERVVRSILHRMGYRFRLNVADLPGKPDIVLPRHKKVVLVNGCFWHGHKNCRKAQIPATNTAFWSKKIQGNIERDRRVRRLLRKEGWQVLTLWECQSRNIAKLTSRIERFMSN